MDRCLSSGMAGMYSFQSRRPGTEGCGRLFVDNTDVYYNYPQESIYDGILTILDYMDHTGRKIMINGGDCFVKKYLTKEKNVLIDGVNQENVFTAYDFSKDVYTKND